MLSDVNNFIAVVVIISMAWFLGWLILDGRKNKKTGSHPLVYRDDEWETLE